MKKEELLDKLTDKQREYDWGSLPDSFSYSQKLSYICHKKDELDREHGIQYITLGKILRGDGCPKCNGKGMDKELFVRKANIVHNYFYKYDNFEYVNKKTKGSIYCPTHKLYFNQSPEKHLMGHGCPKCRYEKSAKSKTKTTEMFITQAKELFGDIYDYHKTLYERDNKKVCIICPEHGEFWQTPYAHMQGQGCSQCKMSHLENKICQLLKDNNIIYEYESNINGILKRKTVDFYLPKINIAIECQGGQHFYGGFNRNDKEKANQIHYNVLRRDIQKKEVLDKNNIRVMYFTDITDLPTDIFTNTKYKGIYCENNFYIDKNIIIEEIMKL